MNAFDDDFTSEEQRQLDLLVDGELSEAERHNLLSSFDERPGAWRRCAIAFLESQVVGHAMPAFLSAGSRAPMTASPAEKAEPEGATIVPASTLRWITSPYVGLPMAAAASFLLAFALATTLRRPPETELASRQAAVPPHLIAAMADPGFAADSGGANRSGATAADRLPRAIADAGETPSPLTLVVDDGASGRESEIPLPIVEPSSAGDLWRDLDQPAVSPAIRDALNRLGHRIEERRQLVPVNLRDGRQAIVPVDDIEIMPVSTRAYQ